MSTPDPPECPVCLEQYNHTTTIPLVLPCGHSTCSTCLTQLHTLSSSSGFGSALSPPNTLHCPSCTHLVSFHSLSSFPKNIDLLRFSLLTPPLSKPHTQPHRFPVSQRLFPDSLYSSFKDWVLPHDVVSRVDSGFGTVELGVVVNEIIRRRLVVDQKVGLFELGRFGSGEDSVFEFSYLNKVMSVLNCMSDDRRSGLSFVFRVSVRVARVCRVLGLWFDVENGCLYLVSEKMNHGLLDMSVGKQDWRSFFGTVGVELCEVLINLQREGLVCGCFGLSCVCFDEFGRVHVDLSEVLVKARKVRECIVEGGSGRRKLEMNASEGEDFLFNMLKMDVFVSPEVMLELLCQEGIEVEKNDLSCAVCYGSDVWSVACLLLGVVSGNEFVEGICNYTKAVLEGTGKRFSKCSIMENGNSTLETVMGSDSVLMLEILDKCLDYASEQRPTFTDVWKNIKALNDRQYMKSNVSFNMVLTKEDNGQCLALNELCNTSSSTRTELSTSNLSKDFDEVDRTLAVEVKVDDFVERFAAGKLECKTLVGHRDCITGFCVGGGFLFSSSFDKTVNIWSLQDFTHVHSFRGHEHRVMAVVYVYQEKPLCISADNGGDIFVWEVIQPFGQKPLKKWCEEKDWRYTGIQALAFSELGHLYTGSGDRLIKAWSLRDATLLCTMEGHKSVVSTLAISNGVLYSGSWDGTVRLWSLHDHSPLAVFSEETPGNVASVLCLYAEQNVVVAAYEKGHLMIWMNDLLKSSKLIHNGAAFALAMQDGWLFSGGRDKTLKVQEIERDEAATEIRDVGSVACDSVITALMYVQGMLFVGEANKLIKVLLGNCDFALRVTPPRWIYKVYVPLSFQTAGLCNI